VAATLHHPNIAEMLEVGRQDDTYFLAMEYIAGDTVRALLERAVTLRYRVPLPVCLHIVAAVAAGLHHAHERKGATGEPLKIVHRDVTPSNIMVSWQGEVKLLDFGIAQATNRAAETQSGTIKGKFAYMSPEQCRGKGVDRRTDVFALGIVLYELTTQRRCFRTDSDFETMDRIVKGRIVKPTSFDAGYPRELEAILLKALALDADQRYPSADAFRRAIDTYAAGVGAATAADIAACLRAVWQEADGEPEIREATASDADAATTDPSAGVATARHLDAAAIARGFRPIDEAATTTPRLPVSPPEPAAAEPELEPAMTGPMPVMSSRVSAPLAVPPLPVDSPAVTGPNPQLPAPTTGPNPRVTPPPPGGPPRPATGSVPVPSDEWSTPQKTILGTGPLTVARAAGAISASRRRPAPAAAAVPLAIISPPSEPTHIRRRHRRGLTLALVAVVIVAAIATAVVLLGGARSDAAAPSAAPSPRQR
jgi:serine/threonine-protein kinase